MDTVKGDMAFAAGNSPAPFYQPADGKQVVSPLGPGAKDMNIPLPYGGVQAPLPPGFVDSQKLGQADKPFDAYPKSPSEPVVPPHQPIPEGPRK